MEHLFEQTDYQIELFKEEAYSLSKNVFSEESFYIQDNSEEIKAKMLSEILIPVHEEFDKEYASLIEKGGYFYGCPFSLYKSTFNNRLEDYLKEHEDNTLITFIESEFEQGVLFYKRPYMNNKTLSKIQASLRMRYEFLVDKSNENNYNVILNEDDTVTLTKQNTSNLITEDDLIEDISDGFSKKDRIIALYKLGVLDFLKEKKELGSINKVAEAIRSFTGIKQGTIQSYINPIYSKDDGLDYSKSALYKSEDVDKVKRHIKKIVYKQQ